MWFYYSLRMMIDSVMKIELEGAHFYGRLLPLTDNETVRKMFILFLKEEIRHRENFRGMMRFVKDSDEPLAYGIDIEKHISDYLDNLRMLFSEPSVQKAEVTIVEALEGAIAIEWESIRIFTIIREQFSKTFSDVLTKIIEEEERHFAMLERVKQKIQRDNGGIQKG